MGVVESMKFPIGNIQQLLAAGMFYFRVDRMGNLQRLCSRTFRIAEYMQLADVQAVDEVAGIFEELRSVSPRVPTITSTPIKEWGMISLIFSIL